MATGSIGYYFEFIPELLVVFSFIELPLLKVLEDILLLIHLSIDEHRLILEGEDEPIFQLFETVTDFGLGLFLGHYLYDYKRSRILLTLSPLYFFKSFNKILESYFEFSS